MPKLPLALFLQRIRRPDKNSGDTLASNRASFDALERIFPVEKDVSCHRVSAGGVAAEWIAAPGVDPGRVLLYLHGGGYAVGSVASHRALTGRLSRAAGAKVLSLDYRLAPEHPFPAAYEDAQAGYRWLLEQGFAPERMAVGGDSSGGGLALSALMALRDAGTPLPAAVVCLSAWTDLALTGDSIGAKAEDDPLIDRKGLERYVDLYVNGHDPKSPSMSPLYGDLRGLPPVLLQVGTSELLLDDSARLAERARAAGVAVTYEPWEDMIHVWQVFAPMLSEGREAIERIGEFLRETLA